jgi:hypothetical protein
MLERSAESIYGENRIFCKGRFITGPDGRSCVISLFMVLVPSVVWQGLVGPFYAVRIHVCIPLIAALFQACSCIFMVATAVSDPGILPRQGDYAQRYDHITKLHRQKEPSRQVDVVIRTVPSKIKYCTTCNIYRPPRATHCGICENCVERFDHHCPWLGNCIGKRNYWLFYIFVISTASTNVIVLFTSALHLGLLCKEFKAAGRPTDESVLAALRQEPVSAALVIYSVCIVWFTFGLLVFHTYLVATNQTTYENIKGTWGDLTNPFNRGIIGNFRNVLCSPVRPRLFNPWTNKMTWPSTSARANLEPLVFTEGMKGDSADRSSLGLQKNEEPLPPYPGDVKNEIDVIISQNNLLQTNSPEKSKRKSRQKTSEVKSKARTQRDARDRSESVDDASKDSDYSANRRRCESL